MAKRRRFSAEFSSLLKNSSAAWNFAISSTKIARKQGKRVVFATKSWILSL